MQEQQKIARLEEELAKANSKVFIYFYLYYILLSHLLKAAKLFTSKSNFFVFIFIFFLSKCFVDALVVSYEHVVWTL